MTPTLKAACGEPASAARSSHPAPTCGSLATPVPWIRRRASSSIAATSLALARVRSSSIGCDDQSTTADLSATTDPSATADPSVAVAGLLVAFVEGVDGAGGLAAKSVLAGAGGG